MPDSAFPTASDRETFAIARELARTDAERATLDALEAQLVALGTAEDAGGERIYANRVARGEKVPSRAALARLAEDFSPEPGLAPEIREHLRAQPRAADVLRGLAWAYTTVPAMRRAGLRLLHEDDRPAMVEVLDANARFADAVFAFIGDAAWRRAAGLAAARDARSMGGGAVFVVIEKQPESTDMDGKALSRHLDRLDGLGEAAGVTAPGAFLGVGGDASEDWFDAADGLRTVDALLAAIQPGSVKLKDKGALRADLAAWGDAMRTALARGARFHLEIDV